MSAEPRRAVFLDRDGTLTVENDWVRGPTAVVLLPGAARAVRQLNAAGWSAILVTNQSAIARGMISEAELAAIHARLAADLAREGARLDAIYYCPHHPTEGLGAYRVECDCRKPASGMIARAASDHGISLERSWIVGDAARDLEAGARLGVRGILVATGKGAGERERAEHEHYAADVEAAVAWILARDEGSRGQGR